MKRISLRIALLCVAVLLSTGVGYAGTGLIAIDHIDGLYHGDSVTAGQNLRFVIKMDNTATNSYGVGEKCDVAAGFRIHSTDGAMWDSTVLDTTLEVDGLGQNKFLLLFSITGAIGSYNLGDGGPTPDTVGTLQAGKGTKALEQLPTTWNDSVFVVNVYFHDKTSAGKHICIDSSFFGQGGTWSWVGKSLAIYTPEWQGLAGQTHQDGVGFCYYIYDKDAPQVSLGVSPSTMTFNATEGGANPAPQVLHITALNGGPLTYNLNMYSDWLMANKLSGSTPDSVIYSPNITGLAAGPYTDSIQVASSGAINSPIYVKVTMTIAAKPKVLKLLPDTLVFTGVEGGANPSSQTFGVTETGGATMAYVASELSPWLSLTNPAGNTPGDVTVNVNLSGIPAGPYFDSIVVAAGSASNTPQWEFVKLTVTAPETKTLVTTPDTLLFLAQENGINPPTQFFQIKEAADKVIPYAAAKTAAWLTLSKESGNTPDSVGVSLNITGLTPGQYSDQITVSSSDPAVAHGRTVVVKLQISACPLLMASKTRYYDTVFVGQPDVVGDSVKITSSGEAISWTVTNIGAGFTIPVLNGTTPGTVGFTFNKTYDTAGTYSSCFTVGTAAPVLRRANKDCTSSLDVCVFTKVIERPCVQLLESDTVLSFEGFEGSVVASKPFTVHTTDSTRPVHFKITRPAEATWLKFVNGADTAAEIDAVDFTQIEVLTDLAGLTPATYTANCSVASADTFVCAPGSLAFTVILNVKKVIIPSTDTVLVSNVPAVPGAQVAVPVNFVNSCPLVELSVSLGFDGNNLHLDSVSFLGSRFAGGVNQALISTDGVQLTSTAAINQTVPGGSGLLANLYFSLNPLATPGVYEIHVSADSSQVFERRKCTDSITTEYPEFIKGGLVTDTASDYVCGWVVDPDGVQIPGATVQLYATFPQGSPEMTTLSTGIGSFAFSGLHTTPFDMYAYKDGYYPGLLTKQNFGAKGVKIVLKPLETLNPTSEWVDYFCVSNSLFGGPIPKGSVVEAFDGNLLVGRWVVTELGKYGFMPVYRASDQFGENGAKTGDVITFQVNGYAAMTSGNTIYPAAYTQEEVCLDAGATVTHDYPLLAGQWNLISWNLDTPTDSITAVMNSIADCIDVVLGYEGGGLTYDPALPQFSTLWSADHLSGYWVKLKPDCSATLSITGLPVNPSTPIPVYTGWNFVSYLPDGSMTPELGFASVLSNLFVAYGSDQSGNIKIFKPNQQLNNTLVSLDPGHGYWLKMNSDGVLTYPGGTPTAVASETPRAAAARLAAAVSGIKPTTSWMNLYSRGLTFNGKSVQAGSIVEAVTTQGVKIGSFTLKQNGVFGFMPVYSDAGSSEVITGLKPGDKFALSVDGAISDQTFEWSNNGDRLEVSALTGKGNANGSLPTTYSLAQNYPNPFNPTTTISFALPVTGNAKLEVFNVLGALVAVPFNGVLEAGTHQIVWDGRDSRGMSVASGVYFYRMSAGSYAETKKMMLLK